MNKKTINALENIIKNINRLKILTKDRDEKYFFDGYEMTILCRLVDEIDLNLARVNKTIKNKYCDVDWNIINNLKDYNDGSSSLKLGSVWKLSSDILPKQLYDKLNNILKMELPNYYKKYCLKKHNIAVKNKLNTCMNENN